GGDRCGEVPGAVAAAGADLHAPLVTASCRVPEGGCPGAPVPAVDRVREHGGSRLTWDATRVIMRPVVDHDDITQGMHFSERREHRSDDSAFVERWDRDEEPHDHSA